MAESKKSTVEEMLADGLMREREVCIFLAIGPTSLWDWTGRGLLQSIKIRGSRRWLRRSVIECAARHLDSRPEVRGSIPSHIEDFLERKNVSDASVCEIAERADR